MKPLSTATLIGLMLLGSVLTCAHKPTGPSKGPSKPSSLSIGSGNEQRWVAGEPLPKPFVVVITDKEGEPVSGIRVEFEVVEGGGELSVGSAVTDRDGRASTVLTLGSEPRENEVAAYVEGIGKVTFHAIGSPRGSTILGNLVQSSTHILIGHVEDKGAYNSSRTDFSIGVEEQIKGVVERNPIHLYIPCSSPEILPSYWASEQLIDRFGRGILQRSARVILFLRRERDYFTLTRINWSVFAVTPADADTVQREDGVVLGLNVPVSDFVHEVRARIEGLLSPDEPGLIMRKIAEGTSQIMIVRNNPYCYMTEQEWFMEHNGQRIKAFTIEKLLWGVLPEPKYESKRSWFIDGSGILAISNEGKETFLAFARLIGSHRLPSGNYHFVLSFPWYSMLWIREGKVFPFDISVEDLVDKIVGLKGL